MDRNSAIGLTLIAALLLIYFYWFSPQPQPPAQQPVGTEPSAAVQPDTLTKSAAPADSILAATYGDLSTALKGEEAHTTIETKDLRIIFSNRGGVVKELELKNFQTYDKQPLKLLAPSTNQFNLLTSYEGKNIDLYALFYTVQQTKNADTTELTYTINLGNGARISQRYKIPDAGFEIRYSIQANGLDQNLSGDNLSFQWNNIGKLMEKDVEDTRVHSTITYYSASGFDELGSRSSSDAEVLNESVKWVAIKQKFFLSALIAKNNFANAEIENSVNEGDPSTIKRSNIRLMIPKKSITDGTADFTFYFGPNDYQIIKRVTEDFSKNVYLGWPPVYWINKFIIFPVFHVLTKVMNNYGLIIIILVILLKLVLFPLSYKSYLSMAKMRVLKPELDEIKERVGEDMTKVQQEQMKLYQQVGVNPISGCIPVLLQMPILFAMFYLFQESIELRQQPFLWAEDLSTYDSVIRFPFTIPFLGSHISIFTVLMTASSLLYTWQNNQISSVQGPMKTMSYIMPLIFFFVLNRFSAGLTFYYLVSTLVTFAQQAIIKRFVDEDKIKAIMEENKKKHASGGAKKSKFMSKLEEAMKASEEARKKADEDRKKKKK